MGYYINTPEGKETYLIKNMVSHSQTPPPEHRDEHGNVAVVLVDNGSFTAAAAAYCQGELEAFSRDDGRRKLYCFLPLAAVEPFMKGQSIKD
jgi:hypothetical protein